MGDEAHHLVGGTVGDDVSDIVNNDGDNVKDDNKDDAVLEEAFRLLSQNKIGAVNYNKYGALDGLGFQTVSEEFIDNFYMFVSVMTKSTVSTTMTLMTMILMTMVC